MIECLIMGDNIAVGTRQFRPECVMIATNNINSYDWINKNITNAPFIAKSVIISLGSNDNKFINTESELRTLRELTKGDHIYWILPPTKPNIGETIKKIAAEYGDTVVPVTQLQANGIHPSSVGYKDIVQKTK